MIIQPTFSLIFINSASLHERLRDITVSSLANKCHDRNKLFV